MGLLLQAYKSMGVEAPKATATTSSGSSGMYQQALKVVGSTPAPTPAPVLSPIQKAQQTLSNTVSSAKETVKKIGGITVSFAKPVIDTITKQNVLNSPAMVKSADPIKLNPGQSSLTSQQLTQIAPVQAKESGASAKIKNTKNLPDITPYLSSIASSIKNTYPGIAQTIEKLKSDPLAITPDPNVSLTKTWEKLKVPFTEGMQAVWDKYYNPPKTVSGKIANDLKIVSSTGNAVLTPFTAFFTALENIPVVASGVRVLSLLPVFAGESAVAVTNKIIDQLPLSQESKDVLKPAVGEVAALAAMLLLGKAVEVKMSSLAKEYGIPDSKVMLEQAKKLVQDRQTIIGEGKQVNLTPDQVRQAQVGIGDKNLSDLYRELNLTAQEKKVAIKEGINAVAPADVITKITDKPYWAKIKSLFGKDPLDQTTVSKTGGKVESGFGGYLTSGEHTPQDVIGAVIKSGQENTPAGKEFIKTAMEAQNSGNNLRIDLGEKKIVEADSSPGTKTEPAKTPEQLASEYLSKRTNKFRQDTNVLEGGLKDTRETLLTKLQSMREGGAGKVAISRLEKVISNIDQKIVEARTKYRVDQSAQDKNLVVVHNIKPGGVINADKIGGLPVPSLAITNVNTPMTNFGDISLIADKNMVDPGNKSNKVFNADAYSPRYPKVENIPNNKAIDYLGGLIDRAKTTLGDNMNGDKYTWVEYFKSDGESGISNSFMSKEVFFAENNKVKPKDRAEVYNYVENNQSQYDSFVSSIVDNIKGDEQIFKGYTPSGYRKYVPHTIDNVVKIMKGKIRDGEGFNYGVGSLRASNAKQYTSLKKIQEDRNKIISSGEMEAIKNSLDAELNDILDSYNLPWDRTDEFLSIAKDYMKGLISKAGLEEYVTSKGKDMTKIVDFIKKLREVPTEYFEAKPQRAVSLSEFKHAVAPSSTPQNVLDILKKNGVEVSTYGTDAERIAIIKQISEQKDLKFRLKDDFKKATGMEITDIQEKQIMDLNKEIFGDQDIKIMGQILTPDGQKALGSYRDGMISILGGKADAVDTFYHEAVHKYFDVFTTKEDQVKLLLYAQEKYGTTDFQATEEKLAEDFINYAKDKKGVGLNVKIKEIFDKIIESIKKYFGSEDKIKKFYDDLLSGVAKQKEAKMQEYRNITQKLFPIENIATIKDVKTSLASIKNKIDELTTIAKGIASVAQEQRSGLNTKDIAQLKRIYRNSSKFQAGDIETIRSSNSGPLLNRVIEDIQIKYPNLSEQAALDFALGLPNKANESVKNAPELKSLRERKKSLDSYLELLKKKEEELLKQGEVAKADQAHQEWQTVLNAQEDLAKVIDVPRYKLPVETIGKERTSQLETRVKEALANISPELKDKLGSSTFNEVNKKENIALAVEYVLKNPDDAIRVLTGEIQAPKGILTNAIYIAMERLASTNVELGLKLASVSSTRMGQEISILTEVNPNSPVKLISDIIKFKEASVEKRYGTTANKQISRVAKEIKKSVKTPSADQWKSFIDSIEC